MSFKTIPSFYLYGEPHRAVAEDFIHVEQLDDRSRPSEWTIRPHAHEDLAQLFLITVGGGTMEAEDIAMRFDAPAILIVPAGVVHGFRWAMDSSGSVTTMARTYVDKLVARHADIAPVFDRPRALDPNDTAVHALRRGIDTLEQELAWSAAGHYAAVEAALLSMLVVTLRALPPPDDDVGSPAPGQQASLVARFRARIEDHFRVRDGIAHHASALGTSQTSLRVACARVAGKSPAAMLDQRAMLEARRFLLYSNLSVAEIGYAIGFADPAYFTRFFTRHAGVSPMRYRRNRKDDHREIVTPTAIDHA